MSEFDYDIYLKDADRSEGFKKSGQIRTPMPRAQRAKQFAPFDALSGLNARLMKAVSEHREAAESETLVHVEIDETI